VEANSIVQNAKVQKRMWQVCTSLTCDIPLCYSVTECTMLVSG